MVHNVIATNEALLYKTATLQAAGYIRSVGSVGTPDNYRVTTCIDANQLRDCLLCIIAGYVHTFSTATCI